MTKSEAYVYAERDGSVLELELVRPAASGRSAGGLG